MVDTNTATDTKGHGLLCPACRVDLVMSERHGIEIDYCPKCRGVWLDRGELDKIIERSASQDARAAPTQPNAPQPVPQWQPYPSQGYYDGGHGSGYGGGHGGGRRHGSFLGRLFD
ncbi:zf-TFIIB domain-containing protein [Tardiphaga sp.]|uniref:TFIIB-type zinc ribbon-containing protein n=1 Tax=Tardiphaga sp. TaxID=1926292 RepID=UPI00352B71F7